MLIAHGSTLKEIQQQNETLITILKALCRQVQADYTRMRLMDLENEKLRQKLFNKANKKKDKRTTSDARHMTSDEVLDSLARAEWEALMKLVFVEARPTFQQYSRAITNHYKQLVEAERKKLKDEEQERKDQKKAEEKQEKAAEKKRKAEERMKVKAAREQDVREKKAAKAVERAKKATEKMAKATKKAAEKIKKAGKVTKFNLESESESPTSDDETDQTTSEDSKDKSDTEIAANLANLNVGQGRARGRGRGRGRVIGRGRGFGSGKQRESEEDINPTAPSESTVDPLTPALPLPIRPRPRPRLIAKRRGGAVPTTEANTITTHTEEDEQEGAPSEIVASGSDGHVVGEIQEESMVAAPVKRYTLRSRRQ